MTDEPARPGDNRPGASNIPEYTVSELSVRLKRTVEEAYGRVRVRGEISGLKRAASGHLYLALKDADAVLEAVCWRGTAERLKMRPEDGLEVVCVGRLTTYAARSKYQLVIERMEPAGIGALMALLEERRRRLAAEGLFDEARKRPIPFLPEVVGVVTSPTGAVIRDILHRLSDRFPRRVLLWPVLVQGEQAAAQIAAAIEGFNRLSPGEPTPRPDVLIVARGGGSIEDLWAFNEEEVVRAAAASRIPLISAVGHETDTTLIDFAADRRAPTPTAAAEMAVPVQSELVYSVLDLQRRLAGAMGRIVADGGRALAGLARGLRDPREVLEARTQRLDEIGERLARGLAVGLERRNARLTGIAAGLRPRVLVERVAGASETVDRLARALDRETRRLVADRGRRLAGAAKLLESLSYAGVLARGYAVVREAGGGPVTSARALRPGMAVDLELHDGRAGAVVDGGAKRRGRAAGKGSAGGEGEQGRLL